MGGTATWSVGRITERTGLAAYTWCMRRPGDAPCSAPAAAAHGDVGRIGRRRPRSGRVGWTLAALVIAAGIAIAACAPAHGARVEPGAGLPAHELDLARSGWYRVHSESGRLASTFGCVLHYETHEPVVGTASGAPTVVLAHGFLRDLRSMRGWATHFASHGVRTVVVSFCNSSRLDGRHDRNAEDLMTLAAAVAPGTAPVLYAGFSAGGLAAYVAASRDVRTVAFLGLDAVDGGGLASSVAPLTVPTMLLTGEPSRCNAEGRFLSLAPSPPPGRTVRVAHATHCDFENPTSAACEWICGRVEPHEAAQAIRSAIRSLATAWILEHASPR